MKLNPDCIRDVLIYLEENLYIDENHQFSYITLNQLYQDLPKYNNEDIFYSIYNLYTIEYIEGFIKNHGNTVMDICEIQNITWDGHQFLNTVRPQTVWDATKKGAKKLGITSISALSMIALEIGKKIVTDPKVINQIMEFLF